MRNLINFLIRYSTWIVFAFYVTISCVLLFNSNPYQRHVYLTSAGTMASAVYRTTNNVTSYFHLRDINEDLQLRNAQLEAEVIGLRNQLRRYDELVYRDTMTTVEPLSGFSFIIAHVINNSIYRPNNFLTLEKGSADGLRPEMGVVDQNGVVGKVCVVSDHTARVISLLNPSFRLSCKVKGSDVFGSLIWDGRDPGEAILEELPRHTVYSKGDTIVTSGYSAVFPEGIPVGTVLESSTADDDDFFTLRIRLLTDFSKLSTVRVIDSANKDEIRGVEAEADKQMNNK